MGSENEGYGDLNIFVHLQYLQFEKMDQEPNFSDDLQIMLHISTATKP